MVVVPILILLRMLTGVVASAIRLLKSVFMATTGALAWFLRRPAVKTKTKEWTPDSIANGILTWSMWPGFQGTHCRVCKCEMNVQGMSYDHWCPECEEKAREKDPDFRHYVMQSMDGEGGMPHERPKFGPTWRTIRAGSRRAMEISESKRAFAVGARVLVQEDRSSIKVGTVVKWEESSWPGMRWYRVDIDGGRKFQCVYERDMAPFRKFADGDAVMVQHRNGWVKARIVRLVNNETSHFLYRRHWYNVDVLDETDIVINGANAASSSVHSSVFSGSVPEEAIRPKKYWRPGK